MTANARRLCTLGALVTLLVSASVAWGQTYPSRPLRFVLPFGPGSGTDILARIVTDELRSSMGASVVVVPYKSTVPAMADIIGGQILWMFVDWAASQGHVRAGRLRLLGVMSDKRSALLPELPAVGETVPGFDIVSWAGVFVPSGTPAAIVERLSAELVKAAQKPAVSQRLAEMGLEPAVAGREELARFVAEQRKSWGAKIKAAGIQPE